MLGSVSFVLSVDPFIKFKVFIYYDIFWFRRHTRKSSTSLELNATKTDDTIDQYALVEENAPYQSLSPSPDGAMERGLCTRLFFIVTVFNDGTKKSDFGVFLFKFTLTILKHIELNVSGIFNHLNAAKVYIYRVGREA